MNNMTDIKPLQGIDIIYTWKDEPDKDIEETDKAIDMLLKELENIIKDRKLYKFFDSIKLDMTKVSEGYWEKLDE